MAAAGSLPERWRGPEVGDTEVRHADVTRWPGYRSSASADRACQISTIRDGYRFNDWLVPNSLTVGNQTNGREA